MIRINLLPVRASRRLETVRREFVLGGLGLAVLVGLLVFASIGVRAQANDLKRRNAAIEADIENLSTIVARVDEVEKLKEDLKNKLAVIGSLKEQKHGPVHLLDELANATPEKVSLTLLEEKSGRLSIKGVAVSNEVISQFLSNLERSEWFSDVYLIEISQQTKGQYKLKEFAITASLVIPGQEEG